MVWNFVQQHGKTASFRVWLDLSRQENSGSNECLCVSQSFLRVQWADNYWFLPFASSAWNFPKINVFLDTPSERQSRSVVMVWWQRVQSFAIHFWFVRIDSHSLICWKDMWLWCGVYDACHPLLFPKVCVCQNNSGKLESKEKPRGLPWTVVLFSLGGSAKW